MPSHAYTQGSRAGTYLLEDGRDEEVTADQELAIDVPRHRIARELEQQRTRHRCAVGVRLLLVSHDNHASIKLSSAPEGSRVC
jgi:hypothetical protein